MVAAEIYDPEQLALSGVEALNSALLASKIPQSNISTEIASVELLAGFVENANGDIALGALEQDESVKRLRDQYNADLVILFQSADMYRLGSSFGSNQNIAGIANINEFTQIDRVFSVIQAGAPVDVFIHEVGHLLGCRHLKEQDPHTYANAFEICTESSIITGNMEYCSRYVSTVMEGGLTGNFRVRQFSSSDPSATFRIGNVDFRTGDLEHDNARMIARTACPISRFGEQLEDIFAPPPPFNAFPSGPTNVSNGGGPPFQYSSYYWGCLDGTVTYHWEISWDYGNTFPHLSYDAHANLLGSNIPSNVPKGYIRLTATCSERSQQSVRFLEIKNWSAHNLVLGDDDRERMAEAMLSADLTDKQRTYQLENSDGLMVYPNPASDLLHINMPTASEWPVSACLISAHGIKYPLRASISHLSGASLSYDIAHLPAGFYVLELQTAQSYHRSPLIIANK